jgi:hypothetical protein
LPNIIDITDIIDVLIERRQRLVTPRSVFPRRPSSVPAATAVLRRKDARKDPRGDGAGLAGACSLAAPLTFGIEHNTARDDHIIADHGMVLIMALYMTMRRAPLSVGRGDVIRARNEPNYHPFLVSNNAPPTCRTRHDCRA